VEIRNKQLLTGDFFDLLRAHKVAYALIDQAWMPRVNEIFEKFDPITSDFTYVRLLGDRKGIEQQTKIWVKVIVDRSMYCHRQRLSVRLAIATAIPRHSCGPVRQILGLSVRGIIRVLPIVQR
jgi:hypothetical protein